MVLKKVVVGCLITSLLIGGNGAVLASSLDAGSGDVVTGNVVYSTHVQNVGWQDAVADGDMSGTEGRSLRLEGITIESGIEGTGIEYATHVQDIGWQDYVADGVMSGTSARSLRLEAIKIRLTGENASKYDVYYRVHAQNVGWMGWAKNDAQSGTAGFGYRLEGIEIKIVEKDAEAPGTTIDSFRDANGLCSAYQNFLVEKQAGLSNGEYLQYYLGDLDSAGLNEMIVAKASAEGVINDYWICQSSVDGLKMVLAKEAKFTSISAGYENMRVFVSNNQTAGKAFQITLRDSIGIMFQLNDSTIKPLGRGDILKEYKDGAKELKPVIFK